jgi:hypothetical protein
MIRILYVADDARTLREQAVPLAQHVASQGWLAQGLADGAGGCVECLGTFVSTRSIDWARGPWDLPRIARASRAIREIVRDGEIDLVHSFSTRAGFLTRMALRNMRSLCYPRVIHNVSNRVPSIWERLAARWTDDVIVTNRDTSSILLRLGLVPAHRLHLVEGIDDPSSREQALALTEAIYARCLGLSDTSRSPRRPRYAGRSTEVGKSRAKTPVAC